MTMTIPTNAELARELAALRAQLAPAPAPKRRRAHRFDLRRLTSLGIIGGLIALVPFSMLAATITISDLNTAAPVHQPNIQAIAEGGITTGFDDPNSDDPNVRVYYPKDNVTREEMASFLARLGGFGTNPPIANAKTAQTAVVAQGVVPGSLTPASFGAAGATPGQVLTATGTGAAFQDPTGPAGPAGPSGATNATVRQATIQVAVGTTVPATVACATGERATGGGYSALTGLTVGESRPVFAVDNIPTGWTATATSVAALPAALVVYAICVPTP